MSEVFIKKVAKIARDDMVSSGILASVTIAQAILESGYGTTELAVNASNFFGMKTNLSGNTWSSAWDGVSKYTKKTNEQKTDGTVYTITADFRKYPDLATSVKDHSLYLLGARNGDKLRYKGLSGERDYRKAIQIIKDGGYATDVNYVAKVCNIIERYNLTQYDIVEEVKDMSKKVLVVLDPGHYPKYNKGAVAGYYEGDKMYTYSEYERDALKAYGVDVIITRKRDENPALYDRGQIAVKNAKGYDVVIFLSNHTNAFNGDAHGVVVYRSAFLPESVKLGEKIVDTIVDVMRPHTSITYSRGVTTRKGSSGADYYGVIRGAVSNAKSVKEASNGPVDYAFIVEHGFHDNVIECTFLNNDANLRKMAEAEARAIADYFGLTKSAGSSKQETTKEETPVEMYRVRKSWADAKSQIGAYKNLESAKKLADENPGCEVYNSAGECVYTPGGSGDGTPFKVKIAIDALNYRSGAGTKYKINGTLKKGEVYTIVEISGSWGKLKSGAGWINISNKYVTRL